MTKLPVVELDPPFSSPDATPMAWEDARKLLDLAEVYWVSTVRPDGRPHVTPVVAVWMDDALYFSTGPTERKHKNLVANSRCVVTTGCNEFRKGIDIVLEGDAVKVGDQVTLERLAELFASKYDDFFGFRVQDGSFSHDEGGVANVFEVAPAKAFGYDREKTFSATRYRF